MRGVDQFSLNQERDVMLQLQCDHARAAQYLVGNYDDHWIIRPPSDQEDTFTVDINSDTPVQCLIDTTPQFLGVYQEKGVVSVLFTVSTKQKLPFCSVCTSQKCKCFHKYRKAIEESSRGNNEEVPSFHWDKRANERPNP